MSENGAISFGSEFSAPPQTPGSSLSRDAGETLLVAPLWTDYAFQAGNGNNYVRYEMYTVETADGRERLGIVSRFLVNRTSDAFNPAWMILVHWNERLPFLSGSDQSANPDGLTVSTEMNVCLLGTI